ncbi:MAG: hypothetical protein BGO67_06365 [Alphaproteobacteria bacterium 41-28]|nr:MAG: hypothetical protein BGO67_06365 [Alphaproteobacteria bacterium 41-28]
MRIIIDLEKEKLHTLTILAEQYHISRAALVRKAIDALLQSSAKQQACEDVFGILKKSHKIEGLSFQKRMRSEWAHHQPRNL